MQKLVRAIALISLLIWSSAITELADDPSSDPTRPLPLRERAVVIFEHSFQLKPVNVADVTVTSPTPGTPPKPKTLSNQVILKFILLATHNTDSEKVESRLVIFQNLNPDPKNSSGNTNKWFWSQFNQNLAKKELSLFDHKLGIQEIPEMEEPLLFSFPVGSRPADIRPAAIPPAPVANQIFYSLLLTHPNIATTPATSSPASLAKETEEIQVTPGTHVEETPAEKTFLDALGDRLQSIPDAVTDDPTPPSAQQIFSFQSHVLPRSRTDIAQNNDEVTVSFPMDLSKAPFNSEASPFQYLADRKTIILRTPPGLKDFYKQHEKLSLYGYMADWITASYTANNSTPEAQAGKEVFASTPVNVLIFNVGKKRRFDFYPTYFTGTLKQATVNHDFAVVPKGASLDIDYLTFFPYIWSFLDPEIRGSPAAPPETSAPVIPVAATDALTASDKSPLPEKKPLYTFPLPGLPTFNYDASGASAGIDLNLTPGDPTNKDLPSLEVSGGKYFDYDFYNVNTNLSWKFTPFVDPVATSADELAFDPKDIGGSGRTTTDQLSSWKGSFGPQFARSVTPNGESSASKTSGMAAFSIEKDVADDSYKWTQTAGISANSNYATGVSTDEYSGTTYAQQLWREHIPWFFGGSPGDYDKEEKTPPANVVTMQIDLNEWTKPAEATQNSNFYTSAASRLHVGADFPVPPCGNDTAEFIRADTLLDGREESWELRLTPTASTEVILAGKAMQEAIYPDQSFVVLVQAS